MTLRPNLPCLLAIVLLVGCAQPDPVYRGRLAAADRDFAKAVDLLEPPAKTGAVEAQLLLGLLHEKEDTQIQDYQRAIYWYEKAAEKGHPRAQYRLGRMYERGLGTARDLVHALELYQRAAQHGNQHAKNRLISLHEDMIQVGEATTSRRKAYLNWLRTASENGDEDAASALRFLYLRTELLPEGFTSKREWYAARLESLLRDAREAVQREDFRRAVLILRPLAEYGAPEAQLRLAQIYREGKAPSKSQSHSPVIAHWYRAAAEQGNLDAQFQLGEFLTSHEELANRPDGPLYWYRKAALQGHAQAQFTVGRLLELGRFSSIDLAESAHWYRKAALQGHRDSQASLARMYLAGEGVDADPEAALRWIYESGIDLSVESKYRLATLFAEGTGTARNPIRAAKWYGRAATEGHTEAQYQLANLYFAGNGVTQDYLKAHAWANVAAAQGHRRAADLRARIEQYMNNGQIIRAQELAREWTSSW